MVLCPLLTSCSASWELCVCRGKESVFTWCVTDLGWVLPKHFLLLNHVLVLWLEEVGFPMLPFCDLWTSQIGNFCRTLRCEGSKEQIQRISMLFWSHETNRLPLPPFTIFFYSHASFMRGPGKNRGLYLCQKLKLCLVFWCFPTYFSHWTTTSLKATFLKTMFIIFSSEYQKETGMNLAFAKNNITH